MGSWRSEKWKRTWEFRNIKGWEGCFNTDIICYQNLSTSVLHPLWFLNTHFNFWKCTVRDKRRVERETKRRKGKKEGRKPVFCIMINSPNCLICPVWTRLRMKVCNSIWISYGAKGAGLLGSSAAAFPGGLPEDCISNRTPWDSNTHTGCCHHRRQYTILCHNTNHRI